MTFAPPTLLALATYWTARGGVNLGIVGDASHVATGVSYHLGRDQLDATAYSRRTARDIAGLSNAASAIDLGRLDGSYTPLRAFSVWLVAQARVNAPGTSDMREIIYTPDGVTVLRWDRERGFASAPRSGEASQSHFYHTHISWYRDAEFRDHRTAFVPYFEGEEMQSFPVYERRAYVPVKQGAKLYTSSTLLANAETITISPGRDLVYVGTLSAAIRIVAYEPPGPPDPNGSSRAMFVRATDIGAVRFVDEAAPIPPKDCTVEIAAAIVADRAKAHIVYS